MRKTDAAVERRVVQFSVFELNAKFPYFSKGTQFFIACGHCLEGTGGLLRATLLTAEEKKQQQI